MSDLGQDDMTANANAALSGEAPEEGYVATCPGCDGVGVAFGDGCEVVRRELVPCNIAGRKLLTPLRRDEDSGPEPDGETFETNRYVRSYDDPLYSPNPKDIYGVGYRVLRVWDCAIPRYLTGRSPVYRTLGEYDARRRSTTRAVREGDGTFLTLGQKGETGRGLPYLRVSPYARADRSQGLMERLAEGGKMALVDLQAPQCDLVPIWPVRFGLVVSRAMNRAGMADAIVRLDSLAGWDRMLGWARRLFDPASVNAFWVEARGSLGFYPGEDLPGVWRKVYSPSFWVALAHEAHPQAGPLADPARLLREAKEAWQARRANPRWSKARPKRFGPRIVKVERVGENLYLDERGHEVTQQTASKAHARACLASWEAAGFITPAEASEGRALLKANSGGGIRLVRDLRDWLVLAGKNVE